MQFHASIFSSVTYVQVTSDEVISDHFLGQNSTLRRVGLFLFCYCNRYVKNTVQIFAYIPEYLSSRNSSEIQSLSIYT